MKRSEVLFTVAWSLLIGIGCRSLFIGSLPGIHFDEAWAANFSYRIFSEPGFWPSEAMSPYTHPESHYFTALFFKFFGVHLWVDRLAGFLMSVMGLSLIALALARAGEKRAALLFGLLASVCVPLVINERLAIELTTFHVLCLGVFVFAISSAVFDKKSNWNWPAIAVSSLLGISAHILFVAPVLAAWGVWAGRRAAEKETRKSIRDSVWISLICIFIFPILWKIHLAIPEKEKSLALLILDAGALIATLSLSRMKFFRVIEKMIWKISCLGFAVFGLYLVFFLEGHWSILFTLGKVTHPALLAITIPAVLVGIVYVGWHLKFLFAAPRDDLPELICRFSIYTVFLIGVMSTKPAPRYFEMGLILILVLVSIVLSKVRGRKAYVFIAIFQFISLSELGLNYFWPAVLEQGVDRDYKFLFFRDDSSDSLPKQKLVAELGKEGCGSQQIFSPDPRLGEALLFLKIGDWPVNSAATCPAQHIVVVRRREADEFLSADQIKRAQVFQQFFLVME